jgi:hypothetical protein
LPQYTEGQVGFGTLTGPHDAPSIMGFDWVKIEKP